MSVSRWKERGTGGGIVGVDIPASDLSTVTQIKEVDRARESWRFAANRWSHVNGSPSTENNNRDKNEKKGSNQIRTCNWEKSRSGSSPCARFQITFASTLFSCDINPSKEVNWPNQTRAKMLLYQDVITGDEMLSDAYDLWAALLP